MAMTLSQKIAHLRESKRITKADMAKALEMDFSNYHRLENRGEKLTLEQIDKIAGALEVTRDYLLNYESLGNIPTEDRLAIKTQEALQEEVKALKKRIDELEDVNSILKEYSDSLKEFKSNLQVEFERIVEFRGEDLGLGEMNVTENNRHFCMYNMAFTESDYEKIIDYLSNKEAEVYNIFSAFLMQGMLDFTKEVTKALHRYSMKKLGRGWPQEIRQG